MEILRQISRNLLKKNIERTFLVHLGCVSMNYGISKKVCVYLQFSYRCLSLNSASNIKRIRANSHADYIITIIRSLQHK